MKRVVVPESQQEKGTGLALSGGGFRASLFHLGALWRLNELGWLPRLDWISSVSGGSITAGTLAVAWSTLDFERDVARRFRSRVVEPLLGFTRLGVDGETLMARLPRPTRSLGGAITGIYRDRLLGGLSLQDLPDRPGFIFNATNLYTGSNWIFQKSHCGDERIGFIREPRLALAAAVAASAALPPVMPPVVFDLDPDWFEKTDGANLYDRIELRRQVVLADGGLYDNMGLESLWNRCDTLLVGDAGGSPSASLGTGGTLQDQRGGGVSASALEQRRELRRSIVRGEFRVGGKNGAYWSLSWPIEMFNVENRLPVHPRWPEALEGIGARFDPLSENQQKWLINWGYAISDASLRRWAGLSGAEPVWPFAEASLEVPPDTVESVSRRDS